VNLSAPKITAGPDDRAPWFTVSVPHRNGRDRCELRGAAMVERICVDSEQRTDPFAWVERDGACHDRGYIDDR
jgi:hypothetical protein